ncbi:MAG: THUMP-like domain-containing protein [Bacteroidota bacterium]
MNPALLNDDVIDFIHQNLNQDLTKLILKGSPFQEISIQEIAQQIAARNKLKTKLPSWIDAKKIVFPPSLNLAQSSSEVTAHYKSTLIENKKVIDLTGGFGIDSFALSKINLSVLHCEKNTALSRIVQHNAKQFQFKNIDFYNGNSIEYLKSSKDSFDYIYIDPARRNEHQQKVFLLEDCAPNVVELQSFFLEKTTGFLVKTSPLLDLKLGLSQLKNCVEIHVVAVKNEVKELLWKIEKKPQQQPVVIKCINFLAYHEAANHQYFEGDFQQEKTVETELSLPQKYLYEPNAAILKSGLFKSVGKQFNLKKLHLHTHLFTSEELVKDFPGKVFEISESLSYQPKKLKKLLKNNYFNVISRNFHTSVRNLIDKFGIREGGEDFLIFTTTSTNKKTCLIGKKIQL